MQKQGMKQEAAEALDIYLKYSQEDTAAYLLLGKMHFNNQEYEETVENMTMPLRITGTSRAVSVSVPLECGTWQRRPGGGDLENRFGVLSEFL